MAALGSVGCADTTSYKIVGDTIPPPLTSEPANPDRGHTLFSTRSDAHCVLCHSHTQVDVPFQGNLGPDLSSVADRLSAAQIRLRLVDYDRIKAGTTMPSYYRTQGLHQVSPEFEGRTVLTALEIEDIIAFLITDADEPNG